jgi:hypothetical protein
MTCSGFGIPELGDSVNLEFFPIFGYRLSPLSLTQTAPYTIDQPKLRTSAQTQLRRNTTEKKSSVTA